jgi:penicillin-binding protein 2
LLKDEPPKELGRMELTPVQRQPILDGLKGVISREEGTAFHAFAGFPNREFPVAGKTGTAQVTKKHDTAIFAAFAPADSPQYAVSVVLEESGFGGSVAAPVAKRILQGIVQPAQPVEAVTLQAGSD